MKIKKCINLFICYKDTAQGNPSQQPRFERPQKKKWITAAKPKENNNTAMPILSNLICKRIFYGILRLTCTNEDL